MAAMHERGPKCFDVGYYRSHNPDLHQAATATEEQLWAHFLHFGQFERRPFRCVPCLGIIADPICALHRYVVTPCTLHQVCGTLSCSISAIVLCAATKRHTGHAATTWELLDLIEELPH